MWLAGMIMLSMQAKVNRICNCWSSNLLQVAPTGRIAKADEVFAVLSHMCIDQLQDLLDEQSL